MIRLLELRQERGLTQRQAAKALFISQGTYNNWENSNTQPSIEQLIAIADFFDVSVDYLICHSDDFSKPSQKNEKYSARQLQLAKKILFLSEDCVSAIETIVDNINKT